MVPAVSVGQDQRRADPGPLVRAAPNNVGRQRPVVAEGTSGVPAPAGPLSAVLMTDAPRTGVLRTVGVVDAAPMHAAPTIAAPTAAAPTVDARTAADLTVDARTAADLTVDARTSARLTVGAPTVAARVVLARDRAAAVIHASSGVTKNAATPADAPVG